MNIRCILQHCHVEVFSQCESDFHMSLLRNQTVEEVVVGAPAPPRVQIWMHARKSCFRTGGHKWQPDVPVDGLSLYPPLPGCCFHQGAVAVCQRLDEVRLFFWGKSSRI